MVVYCLCRDEVISARHSFSTLPAEGISSVDVVRYVDLLSVTRPSVIIKCQAFRGLQGVSPIRL